MINGTAQTLARFSVRPKTGMRPIAHSVPRASGVSASAASRRRPSMSVLMSPTTINAYAAP